MPSGKSSRRTEAQAPGLTARWATFVRERFEPVSHLTLIALFFIAHLRVARAVGTLWLDDLWPHHVPLFLATLLFFFKLRLYDELKDHETDLKLNPNRPLARGLLLPRHLKAGILFCLVGEIALVAFASRYALPAFLGAVAYSLLMYREFLVGRLIRPHLTTYALLHTVVCVLLSLSLFSALAGRGLGDLELGRALLPFALAAWGLFNVFEFGRKTFTRKEERPGVDSYSRIFGRPGAVILTLLNAVAAAWLISRLPGRRMDALQSMLLSVTSSLAVIGALYAALNQAPWGRVYRGAASAFILVVLGGVVALC